MALLSSPPQAVLERIYTVLEIDYEATLKELEDTYKCINISQHPDKLSETSCTGLEINLQPTVEKMVDFCTGLAMAQCPESARFTGDDASLDLFHSNIVLTSASAYPKSGIAGLSSLDNVPEPTAEEEAKILEGRTTAWPDDGLLESFRKEGEYRDKLALLGARNEYHSHEWIETQNKLDRELHYQTGWREEVEKIMAELG